MRNFIISRISQIKINKKSFAFIAVVIVLITALVASLFYVGSLGIKKSPNDSEVVSNASSEQAVLYKKADGVYLTAKEKTRKVEITDDSKYEITDDSRYLIFTVPSAKANGKFDLYVCNLTKASKVKKDPVIIDCDVESGFKYSNDVLYYSKQNASTLEINSYRYNLLNKENEKIDFGIIEIYIPKNGSAIYYTKDFHDSVALYEYSPSKGTRELAKPVSSVHFYDDDENCELLYELKSKNKGTSDLYKVVLGKNPTKIAIDVSKVMYDKYKVGGNLYYFVKKNSPTDWHGIIEDDMKSSDEKLKKPKKSDYRFFFGVSINYKIAMEKYDSKVLRDEIRNYLNKEIKKDLFRSGYCLYVKTGDKTHEIASSVSPDDVYAVSESGLPRIIYSSVEIKPSGKKLSDFTDNLEKRKFQVIKPDIDKVIEESIVEKNLSYADLKNKSIEMKGYEPSKCKFVFAKADNEFFVKVLDKNQKTSSVYRQLVSDGKITAADTIGDNIKQIKLIDTTLWYVRHDSDMLKGSLQKYSDSVTQSVETNVYAFNANTNEDIIIYKDFNNGNGDETVTLYHCDGEKTELISKGVDVKQIKIRDGSIMFIRNSQANASELCSYKKGKLHVVDTDVYNILDY